MTYPSKLIFQTYHNSDEDLHTSLTLYPIPPLWSIRILQSWFDSHANSNILETSQILPLLTCCRSWNFPPVLAERRARRCGLGGLEESRHRRVTRQAAVHVRESLPLPPSLFSMHASHWFWFLQWWQLRIWSLCLAMKIYLFFNILMICWHSGNHSNHCVHCFVVYSNRAPPLCKTPLPFPLFHLKSKNTGNDTWHGNGLKRC